MDLLAGLAVAMDLGMGKPPETALRTASPGAHRASPKPNQRTFVGGSPLPQRATTHRGASYTPSNRGAPLPLTGRRACNRPLGRAPRGDTPGLHAVDPA